MKYLIRTWFVLAFVCLSFVSVAHTTHAATLFFSPSSGSYAVGKTFTVNVLVGSADQAANAYSGTITYPTDKLEMTAIGKGGTIVSLWVREPSFSAGSANFEGITLNPGYTGGAGRMVSLTFKAKAVGSAVIRFSAGSVLANDGSGTSILKGMGSATFTITGPEVKPPVPVPPKPPTKPTPPPPPLPPAPVVVVEVPAAPLISSTSHPDSTQWYPLNSATFAWDLQKGVDGAKYLVDQDPASDPGTVSAGLFSSSTLPNVGDGIWYFHLRVHNQGGWSAVSSFKFQIDAKIPDSFTISEVLPSDANRTTKAFTFNAVDSGSGIDHYEIQIDDGAVVNWVDDGTHIYHVSDMGVGVHALRAKAIDKAGNFLETAVNFTVEGLVAPQITEYPRSPVSGDELVLKGTATPNSKVTIWVQKEQGQPYSRDITSDLQGRFAFIASETLELATYKVWATASDAFGNVSVPSETITLLVKAPPFNVWAGIKSFLLNNRCILTISLLLLILLILICKYILLKKKLKRNAKDAKEALQLALVPLKEDVLGQITAFEKAKTERALTTEENATLEKFKQDLINTENYIRERIEVIEKRK